MSARGRALPVVVAAGLAIGVFAGLVVVRGTGQAASESQATASADASAPKVVPANRDAGPGALAAEPTPDRTVDAGAVPATKPATVVPAVAAISFEVRPRNASVFVDGARVPGMATQVALARGKARIKVVVKARGHKSHSKSYEVTGDQIITISLRRDRKDSEPTGPGGLLDIQ